MDNLNECIICFELLNNDNVALLSCGHKYHYKCIQNWIKSKKTLINMCPICNEGKNVEIINIYETQLSQDNYSLNENLNENLNQNLNENESTFSNLGNRLDSETDSQSNLINTESIETNRTFFVCCNIL